jgi:transcription elongation factor Elf1
MGLSDEITRENALKLLATIGCPCCHEIGLYKLFDEPGNNGVGIECGVCGKRHPFQGQRIMWLRSGEKRRANDVTTVMTECGAYCYICGLTFEQLRTARIPMHVHHTERFADVLESGKKIPLCAVCHEMASLMQRTMRRLFVK